MDVFFYERAVDSVSNFCPTVAGCVPSNLIKLGAGARTAKVSFLNICITVTNQGEVYGVGTWRY